MPSLSPPSNADPAQQQQQRPVDVFTLKTNGHVSVLDAVFISKRSKRAVYATITRGAETTLWRAASSGVLLQIARIEWEHELRISNTIGDGSLRSATQTTKKVSMLTFDDKMVKVEDFLRKGRGWFSSDSKLFTVDDTEYKWKSGMDNAGTTDGQPVKNANTAYQEAWKVWRCTVANTNTSPVVSSSSTRPAFQFPILGDAIHAAAGVTPEANAGAGRPSVSSPAAAALSRSSYAEAILGQVAIASAAGAAVPGKTPTPAPPVLLARFAPPQRGLTHNEIAFYPALFFSNDKTKDLHTLESLLVSAILLTVGKGEWKEVQSVVDAPALQAVFVAEAAGEVPPYTPRPAVKTPQRPFTRVRSNSGPPPRSRPEDSPFAAIPAEISDTTPLIQRRGSLRVTQSRPSNRGIPRTSPSDRAFYQTGSYSAPPTQRHIRPSTSDGARAGDGFYAPRRPSLRVTTATPAPPVLSRGEGSNSGHSSTHPSDTKGEFSGLPPAYS